MAMPIVPIFLRPGTEPAENTSCALRHLRSGGSNVTDDATRASEPRQIKTRSGVYAQANAS
eukprot:6202730-Pleurochrysis_carterae.AAC.1